MLIYRAPVEWTTIMCLVFALQDNTWHAVSWRVLKAYPFANNLPAGFVQLIRLVSRVHTQIKIVLVVKERRSARELLICACRIEAICLMYVYVSLTTAPTQRSSGNVINYFFVIYVIVWWWNYYRGYE